MEPVLLGSNTQWRDRQVGAARMVLTCHGVGGRIGVHTGGDQGPPDGGQAVMSTSATVRTKVGRVGASEGVHDVFMR